MNYDVGVWLADFELEWLVLPQLTHFVGGDMVAKTMSSALLAFSLAVSLTWLPVISLAVPLAISLAVPLAISLPLSLAHDIQATYLTEMMIQMLYIDDGSCCVNVAGYGESETENGDVHDMLDVCVHVLNGVDDSRAYQMSCCHSMNADGDAIGDVHDGVTGNATPGIHPMNMMKCSTWTIGDESDLLAKHCVYVMKEYVDHVMMEPVDHVMMKPVDHVMRWRVQSSVAI